MAGTAARAWPPDHYAVLGLTPGEPDVGKIEEHTHDRLARLRQYQLNHPDQVTEAMNRLAEAFSCLTDPAAKKAYDATLGLTRATSMARRSETTVKKVDGSRSSSTVPKLPGAVASSGVRAAAAPAAPGSEENRPAEVVADGADSEASGSAWGGVGCFNLAVGTFDADGAGRTAHRAGPGGSGGPIARPARLAVRPVERTRSSAGRRAGLARPEFRRFE